MKGNGLFVYDLVDLLWDFYPRAEDFEWEELETLDFIAPGEFMAYSELFKRVSQTSGIFGQAEGEEIWRNRSNMPKIFRGQRILFPTIWGDPESSTRQMFYIDSEDEELSYGFVTIDTEAGLSADEKGYKIIKKKI